MKIILTMAKSIPSTSTTLVPTHEQNISMLFDKLKRLKMSTENRTDASIFGRVEREYNSMNCSIKCVKYQQSILCIVRTFTKRNG